MTDIFQHWAGVSGDVHIHPDDMHVMRTETHSFRTEGLPGPFNGPLKKASVVLLTLNPGFEEYDIEHAASEQGQDYYFRSRSGICDLPSFDEHFASAKWSEKIVRQFGIDYELARSRFSFINLIPYKSKKFSDYKVSRRLKSYSISRKWVNDVLFPESKEGKRVVICLRAAREWGLRRGGQYEGKLFAPMTTPGAIIYRGPERDRITSVVRAACGVDRGPQ